MMSAPKVTLIRHHVNDLELDDTVTRKLLRLGFTVEHRYPFNGDVLDPVNELTPTIVLGGGQNVTDIKTNPYLHNEIDWILSCMDKQLPLLGICLGGQLIAHALGARVFSRAEPHCEFGVYAVTPTPAAKGWLDAPQHFVQAHYQEFDLPAGATLLASSELYINQAFRFSDKVYGLQFHPEVTLPIFRQWQQDEWSVAMSATAGAQSRSEQDLLAARHLAGQTKWLERFLETLFVIR